MASKDHYVSQTYLRLFVGPNGGLVPYYKNARVIVGKSKSPKSICFEIEGNTNKYFEYPRILEKRLPAFENPWKDNVDRLEQRVFNAKTKSKLEHRILDAKTKFELAGYIAFLRLCTPTAKRIAQQGLSDMHKFVQERVMLSTTDNATYLSDKDKCILREVILKRERGPDIEREHAHAQCMVSLDGVTYRYYCSSWMILINETNIPFITSDNPAILYRQDIQQQIAQTYIPLKPSMALLITPDLDIDDPTLEDAKRYSNSKNGFGFIPQSGVTCVNKFNEAIVKSAERMVLHQKKEDWLEQLVRKYSK
ncbi:MAG: DUF4238 domain-containing protein [Planctomycetes bacterium]|nr:DUF4238 domain-containing protein [Planctomycetota bacterium]MBU1518671.1 DUF4238 domain-containing protein [Planctomycetota bacterium]MBU2457903.1 DUF4238 domain-containing protein [Planctomycetota bacterium]MBU2596740.1 DUF4238 domain-containing protein [Planctomycetota bacterium]